MNTVNAIAKVRFSATRPQRVQLHKDAALLAELLCMEAGQEIKVPAGEWVYYVAMGAAKVAGRDGQAKQIGTGHFAAFSAREAHTITNAGEGRLVCIAVSPT